MKWIVPRRQSVRARRRAMPPIATRPMRHVGEFNLALRWSRAARPLRREILVSNATLSPAASDAQKGFNQQTVGRISQD